MIADSPDSDVQKTATRILRCCSTVQKKTFGRHFNNSFRNKIAPQPQKQGAATPLQGPNRQKANNCNTMP